MSSSDCGTMEFKDIVHEWISLYDEIHNFQSIIRNKRKRLNQLQHHIIIFMKEQNKQICNVGDANALVMKQRKSSKTLKKSDVINLVEQHSKLNHQQVLDYVENFYKSRPSTIKDYIHLTDI